MSLSFAQKAADSHERPFIGQSLEQYAVTADLRSIERRVVLRTGSVGRTAIPLELGSSSLTQDELAERFDSAFLQSQQWPRSNPTSRAVRFVDLFSGCGSMSLGVWEGCRAVGAAAVPVMALDFNQAALEVYKDNFPGAWTIPDPIETLVDGPLGAAPSRAERDLVGRLGSVDIVVGGPPCQGHSNLNNHTRREDPKNKLYERMARFAELVKPGSLIIENVSAVLHDKGKVVERTIAHLRRLGYRVDDAVVNAVTVGVPQYRRRHFVVASTLRQPDIKAAFSAFLRPQRSVKWAFAGLGRVSRDSVFDQASNPTPTNIARIRYLFENKLFELPDKLRPDCHRTVEHSYKSVYGRLRATDPAPTITSGFLSMGQGRYVHPTQRRTITPHEAARIQFFPDFFRFNSAGGRTALAEMIGNAVPSKLAYVLTAELLR